MYVPSIFTDNGWNDFFAPTRRSNEWGSALMKTDIQEVDGNYQMGIDLPGFSKENIKLNLEDGYLTVEATRENHKEEEDGKKYLRRERFYGSCKRTFQVDKGLTEEDIKARYENGVLTICFPKEVKRPLPEKKRIAID